MKKIHKTILCVLLFPVLAFSQTEDSMGLDEQINTIFAPISRIAEDIVLFSVPIGGGYEIPLVIVILVLGGLFFTGYFSFINFRKFGLAINVVRGKYDDLDKEEGEGDSKNEGEVSHFQALTTAISGTVGLGNIAGVAMAISIGGPGATFWMIVCGTLGMSLKFVECTLGVKYREVSKDGTVYGGPMYYISRGLKELNREKLGKITAIVFSILCIGASFGGGNAAQSNQIAKQVISVFNITNPNSGTYIGVLMALIVGLVIIGGIKRIATVTEKIVPFMAVIYILACFVVIFGSIDRVGEAFMQIIEGAFSPQAGVGGVMGVIITGFRRAAFSNEAGSGSAPIAHSAVKTRYPASEGLVSLLEPFIDTVVICTMTALVIILYNDGIFEYGTNNPVISGQVIEGGAVLTSMAFESVISWFPYVLTVAIVLFAISTMISWSYYGVQACMFLFGREKRTELTYKIIFILFIIVGAAADMKAAWGFSDAMIIALIFPNIIGLLFLYPKVKEDLNLYLKKIKEKNNNK